MKFTLGASWLPKVGGLGAILAGLGSIANSVAHGTPIAWDTILPSISAGFGLLFARQNNVSSEKAGAVTTTEPPKP